MDNAFVVDRRRCKGIAEVAVIDRDCALNAINDTASGVDDAPAADGNRFGKDAICVAGSRDRPGIDEGNQAVDVNTVTVGNAVRIAGDEPVIGDRRGCVAGGVEIDAGAGFALDDAIGVIGDGDRIVAGDAVTGAVDQPPA